MKTGTFKSRVVLLFALVSMVVRASGAELVQSYSAVTQVDSKEPPVQTIIEKLYNPADPYVQISAHRGVAEKLPENGIGNILRSIELGFDIIEIDLSVTSDGEIVLMHDKTLDRTTTGTGLVSDHSLKELKTLYLKNIDGSVTGEKIPTLHEVLDVTKGRVLLQMDKWQGLLDKVLPILEQQECLQYAIFRSTMPYEKIEAVFGDYLERIIYIPVIPLSKPNSQELLSGYLENMPDMPVICLVFSEETDLDLDQVAQLKPQYRIWYNAIADRDSAKHGDLQALEGNLDGSYGWLVERGANIIFTDRAILLNNYLKSRRLR